MTENTTQSEVFTEFSTAVIQNNDDEDEINEQLKFIIVPLAVIATVMLLSALVFLMARKRRLDVLRHRLMPLYNFDKTEHESDWETEFLTNVDNPNYTDYCTTKFTQYED
ncbi:hypothetical protein CBL_02244 [Carabus blaptoides fortunei]